MSPPNSFGVWLEYLLLAHDLGLLDGSGYEPLARGTTEAKRMLTSFMKKLRADR